MIQKVFFRANSESCGWEGVGDQHWFGEESYSVGEITNSGKKITQIEIVSVGDRLQVSVYTGEVPYCVIPWHMVCRMYYA